jgi:predicted AlkP superfamily pyrophosphatase or phosphodiesterase
MRHKNFRLMVSSLVGLVAATTIACMRATASAEGTPLIPLAVAPPKLVVFIAVDQLRGDMLDRYRSEMSGGYGRLMRGAWFVNAYQDHAITETAPGHASTMSGRFPRSTGIITNSAGVVDRNYALLNAQPNEPGASPLRFNGTTLFDWLHAKDNRSRAVSVSMKDRSAILMIGRAKQNVYWYSGNGSFTTSNYYRDTLPTWVRDFNARRIPHQYAGSAWRLSRDTSTYREPDSVAYENRGRDVIFPHRFPTDTARALDYFRQTPAMDSLTALFALEGLRRTGLGQGPQTDILAVSFSATDVIGHTFGPDSREAHENQLRLDQTIGWFLDSVYAMRDSGSVIVALTGDHGVQPNPQLARDRGEATGDQGLVVSLSQQARDVRAGLRAAGADTTAFQFAGQIVGLDRQALSRANVNADSLLDAFARAARQVPGVLRVDRMRALRRADFQLDPIARRWAHQIPESMPVELVITLTKYSYWYQSTATHGSPHDLDAHVPVIFYGPGVKPGRYTNFARVVDMAPTLAQLTGARPGEKLDGVVLLPAIVR